MRRSTRDPTLRVPGFDKLTVHHDDEKHDTATTGTTDTTTA